MTRKYRIPGNKATVLIRNDGPMIHCGDSPSYRTVQISLTPEQINLLELELVGTSNGHDYYEEISKIILERP
jgi:hypothetical protein